MDFEPIGTVKSTVFEPVDENWGEVVSEICLLDSLVTGLNGLESFSHVIVIFLMHEASFNPEKDLVRRPRGLSDMPELGIFAQRARHRPNRIGITAVQLLQIEGNVLKVKGLDAINGTPVLDIKPYFPIFDGVSDAITPTWVDKLMEGYF